MDFDIAVTVGISDMKADRMDTYAFMATRAFRRLTDRHVDKFDR
jgi:hypothetical protein